MIDIGEVAKHSREVYGNHTQIAVTIEELSELIAILCKYYRYPDESEAVTAIRDKVLEETADVRVVLNHVYGIFNLTETEIEEVMQRKAERVQRWLDTSKDFKQSTIDRDW